MSIAYTETQDRWIFALRDSHVARVAWDGGLVTFGLEPVGEITVGEAAVFTTEPPRREGVEQRLLRDCGREDVEEVVGAAIASCVAFKTGGLRVVFRRAPGDARHLSVDSDAGFVPAWITAAGEPLWERPHP